jgi:hypothetical protein
MLNNRCLVALSVYDSCLIMLSDTSPVCNEFEKGIVMSLFKTPAQYPVQSKI